MRIFRGLLHILTFTGLAVVSAPIVAQPDPLSPGLRPSFSPRDFQILPGESPADRETRLEEERARILREWNEEYEREINSHPAPPASDVLLSSDKYQAYLESLAALDEGTAASAWAFTVDATLSDARAEVLGDSNFSTSQGLTRDEWERDTWQQVTTQREAHVRADTANEAQHAATLEALDQRTASFDAQAAEIAAIESEARANLGATIDALENHLLTTLYIMKPPAHRGVSARLTRHA